MINKKSIFLITMIGIFLYLLYVFIFYPYQRFKEYSTQDDNKVASDLMNNSNHIYLNEINSHYVNIRNVPGYKYAYENPLRFNNYYLDFIKKNKIDMKQLDLILKLSCQLPPKNQLDFYQKALDILSKNNVDKKYLYYFSLSMSNCVAKGYSFLPTGSYFWIPYLKYSYQDLGKKSPELKESVAYFIDGSTFFRYLGYKLGERDS